MAQLLMDYKTIINASHGDIDAINLVLDHFEQYTNKLALRFVISDLGNVQPYIDTQIKQQLENKLIQGILKFKG